MGNSPVDGRYTRKKGERPKANQSSKTRNARSKVGFTPVDFELFKQAMFAMGVAAAEEYKARSDRTLALLERGVVALEAIAGAIKEIDTDRVHGRVRGEHE